MNSPKMKKIRQNLIHSTNDRINHILGYFQYSLNVLRSQVRQDRTDLGRPKINQTYITESDSFKSTYLSHPSLENTKAKLDVLAEDLLVKKKESNFNFGVMKYI